MFTNSFCRDFYFMYKLNKENAYNAHFEIFVY